MRIPVLYEDNHLLVVQKPVNIPVQRDESGSDDMQRLLQQYLKAKYQKPGNVYLGIVHRLDRPVSGVMVFAKTSKAAARLTAQFAQGGAHKRYYAIVRGQAQPCAILEDYLKKGAGNMTSVVDEDTPGGKYAKLKYQCLEQKQGMSFLEIELFTGRSHQIRVQLSSRGLPIWGDIRYGHRGNKKGQQIALLAYELSFEHPTLKQTMRFQAVTPQTYPWTLFHTLN